MLMKHFFKLLELSFPCGTVYILFKRIIRFVRSVYVLLKLSLYVYRKSIVESFLKHLNCKYLEIKNNKIKA